MMDLYLQVRSLSLLILCCGDVESNPGPPKVQPGPSKNAPSETLRTFTRSFQPELVRLIYEANNEPIPKAMYKQDPPGWNSLNDGIEFKSICNARKGGNEIFDKLIKLYMRTVKTIPRDILDVILCYEKLRDSNLKNEETEKWKTTLEKFISQNKLKKNEQVILQHLNEETIIIVLNKATELMTQGVLRLTNDAVISAYHDFGGALIKQTGEKLYNKLEAPSGIKRPATREIGTMTEEPHVSAGAKRKAVHDSKPIKEDVKRQKTLSPCRFQGMDAKSQEEQEGGEEIFSKCMELQHNEKDHHVIPQFSEITNSSEIFPRRPQEPMVTRVNDHSSPTGFYLTPDLSSETSESIYNPDEYFSRRPQEPMVTRVNDHSSPTGFYLTPDLSSETSESIYNSDEYIPTIEPIPGMEEDVPYEISTIEPIPGMEEDVPYEFSRRPQETTVTMFNDLAVSESIHDPYIYPSQ
uniref:Uncharacterized protein LOC111138186 isoform X2 n=1 Tax=Crassostrea virginica TaxID=6565 RepID=A0A8B8F0G1_CRAVI|nr:uncharacterized protein LOC111138186 isoform X2 [Crassostrea virginica]